MQLFELHCSGIVVKVAWLNKQRGSPGDFFGDDLGPLFPKR